MKRGLINMVEVNFNAIYELLKKANIKQYKIFISCSNKNFDIISEFIDKVSAEDISFWCMYDKNGNQVNHSGADYKVAIDKALSHTCSFVCFFSEYSIVSSEVHEELIKASILKKKNNITIHPIFMDGLSFDEVNSQRLNVKPELLKKYNLPNNATIADLRIISSNSIGNFLGKEKMHQIFNNIAYTYYLSMLSSITEKYTNSLEAQKFCNLMNKCIKHPCCARSISTDIKYSDEINESHKLQELHILSNELMEYDCNPYSCMIIATNLLGDRGETTEGQSIYTPEKNGVKYYYYCTKEYLKKYEDQVKEKITSFLRKDIKSRKEVIDIIKREYCRELELVSYFKTYNLKSVDDLVEKFQISSPAIITKLNQLFESEPDFTTINRQRHTDCIIQPITFIKWLSGEKDYDRKSVYKYIDLMNSIKNIISDDAYANKDLLTELQDHIQDLIYMRDLEEWQYDGKNVKSVKQLVKLLLDPNNNCEGEKFPKLIQWLCTDINDQKMLDIYVDQAMNNLFFIPVEDNELLQLCYSFIIFIQTDKTTAMWYTTGYSQETDYVNKEGTVFVYEIPEGSAEKKQVNDAYSYMININQNAKKTLTESKSKLLSNLQNI